MNKKKTKAGFSHGQWKVFGQYFLKSLIESSLSGILVVDKDSRVVVLNQRFLKMWHIPPTLAKTSDDEKLLSFATKQLKDPSSFKKRVRALYSNRGEKSKDLLEFSDGRFFQRYSTILKDYNGDYFGRIWYFQDVTEEKKSEIELRVSEDKCRTIFDSAADIVFIASLENSDGLGKFLKVNKTFCRKLGYSKKNILQMTPWQIVTKSSMINARRDLEKLKKHGRATFERVMIAKDGRTLPVEMNVRMIKFAGQPLLMAIARDISDRKMSENALIEERNKLQKYLDVSGIITIIFNADQKVLLINKKGCEVFGCRSGAVLGKNWVDLFVANKYKEETRSRLDSLLKGDSKAVMVTENIVKAAGGEERNIIWRFALLSNGPSKSAVALGVGSDITDFKQAKATIGELKELNNLKDEFLNIATHELKTPLTSIIGLSEILIGKLNALPSKYLEYLKIINLEGLRLAKIMRRMLDVSRYESGRMLVIKERFNLPEFIQSIHPSLLVLAKDKVFKYSIAPSAEGLLIDSDKQRISQVIYDLVDNAVKHADGARKITLSLRKKDNKEAVIEIIDDGQGIPPESHDKLFLKFYQLKPSLSRPQEGIGLGLYSCKLAVESLGGKIGVKSSLGKGSNFYFTLPL